MGTWTRFLSVPVLTEEDHVRISRLLDVILQALLGLTAMYGAMSVIALSYSWPALLATGVLTLLAAGLLLLNRRGHVYLASLLLVVALWAAVTLGTFGFGGVRGPGPSGYIVVILMAGLLLGGAAGLVSAGLSFVGGLGVLVVETSGLLPPSFVPLTSVYVWTVVTAVLIMSAVLLYLGTRGISDALERARREERAVAEANRELQREVAERMRAEAALKTERASLARRVAERTAELSMANAELVQALRARNEFLAAMSHELRTPLNAILGLTEALQEGVYGPCNERQLKSLSRIDKSAQSLLNLINNVLDVVQIGAGRSRLEMAHVPVEPVFEASLEAVRSEALKKRLKVVSTYDSAVESVWADPRRLEQILVNLLDNAVKFTPEEGTVGLEMEGDAEREMVQFTVWDTGIGISEEEMGRLFQPFVQLDSSLSRRYGGMGLGLALVRQLVDMHGGSVTVESEEGKGSRFTVSLPWRPGKEGRRMTEEHMQAIEQGPEPAMEGRQPAAIILVAEDNEYTLDTVSDYLAAKGYQVVMARNGTEAIARAREARPDVILMDIQMPEMDGLEAIRRIRADADLASVPIVALTALALPGDRDRCMQAGATVHMSKPIGMKQVVQVIEAQLAR